MFQGNRRHDVADDNSPLFNPQPFHGARIKLTTPASIATSTFVDLTFDTVDFDTDSFWNAGTPKLLTPPSSFNGSIYICYAHVKWGISSTNTRRALIYRSTGTFDQAVICDVVQKATSGETISVGSTAFEQCMHGHQKFATGDAMSLQVWQNSGGPLNITSAEMEIVKIN